MNFDDIKKEMDKEVSMEEKALPTIDLNRGKNNPVQMIRSNMKKEIITQLVCIVIFMVYPLVVYMPPLSEAVYWIFMFITSMMTMGYIIKLSYFLRRTTNLTVSTKDTIQNFIYETKLTLEVYKSFIIAGSLLLPVPVFALLAKDHMEDGVYVFEKWFMLDVTPGQITLLIIGYLVAAIIFYYITREWAKMLYGKYLNELENVLQDLTD